MPVLFWLRAACRGFGALLCGCALVLLAARAGLGQEGVPATPAQPLDAAAQDAAPAPAAEAPVGRLDDEAVRRVDQALIAALSTAGVDVLRMLRVDPPYKPDPLLQYIEISTPAPPDRILDALDKTLADIAPTAALVSLTPEIVQIVYNGAPTHVIVLRSDSKTAATPRTDKEPGASTTTTTTASNAPRIAIVIDDLGESLKPASELAALGLTLNFSVFPHGPATAKIVAAGRAAGFDILVHQPMEPLDAENSDPGAGAIYCRMNDAQIQAAVRENLQRVKDAVALSNHMGSRFTQDPRALAAVIAVLRERRLFCLDSLTHPKSVFTATAKPMNVPCLKRDVFLDLIREQQAILRELEHAERIARKHGAAIAIGHPVAPTIAALRTWKVKRDKSIALVTLSALIP